MKDSPELFLIECGLRVVRQPPSRGTKSQAHLLLVPHELENVAESRTPPLSSLTFLYNRSISGLPLSSLTNLQKLSKSRNPLCCVSAHEHMKNKDT
jgi:hypothetical protein